MKMKFFSFLAFAALVLAIGCSSGAEGDAQVATTFRVNSIVSEGGTNEIAADMVNADEGITADFATVTVGNNLKNPSATPTSVNDVVVNRYAVTFSRSDGGTVFASFEGGLSQVVEVNGTSTFNIVIVRLSEKTNGALAGWRAPILDMDAHITLYGRTGSGETVSASASIKIAPGNYGDDTGNLAPVIGSFIADKSNGVDGDSVTLSWYISGGVNSVILNPGSIELNPWDYYPYGSYTINNVDFPQTFTLMVGGIDGFAVDEVEVDEQTGSSNLPTVNVFTAQPGTIGFGESSILSWNITNATSAVIYPSIGTVSASTGEMTVSPEYDTTYTLVAQNSDGIATKTVSVKVDNAEPEIVYFLGSVDEVTAGQVVHLSWAVQGNYTKLELFPYYSEADDILDVTDLNSLTTEPVNAKTTFVLTAYGQSTVVNETFEVDVVTATPSTVSVQSVPSVGNELAWTVSDPDFENQDFRLYVVAGDAMVFAGRSGVVPDGQGEIRTALMPVERTMGYSVVQLAVASESGSIMNAYGLVSTRGETVDRGIETEFAWNKTRESGLITLQLDESLLGASISICSVSGERDLMVKNPNTGLWTSLVSGLVLPVSSSTMELMIRDAGQEHVADHAAILAIGTLPDGHLSGNVAVLNTK